MAATGGRSGRNQFLFGVKAVNPDFPHQQLHQFALILERKRADGVLELQQCVGDPLFVDHDFLTESDVDFNLLKLTLQLVLLLSKVLSGSEGLLAEVARAGLASQHEVAGEFTGHLFMTALKLRTLLFQRTQRAGFFLIGSGDGGLNQGGAATDFTEDFQDEFIQGAARNVADGASRSPPILADIVAGVVKVLVAIAILFPARFGGEPLAADAAMQDALEERPVDVAVGQILWIATGPCLAAEGIVGLLPEFGIDQRRMFAGVILSVMADDSFVKGIGDHGGDLVANVTSAAHDGLGAPAAVYFTFWGAQSFGIQNRSYLGRAAQLAAEFEDPAGEQRVMGIDLNFLRHGIVSIAKRSPAAVPHAALGPLGQLVLDAFDGGFPFELVEGKQHVDHEQSHRCAGVEGLGG